MGNLPGLGQYVSLQVFDGLLKGYYDSRVQDVKDNSLWLDLPLAVKNRQLYTIPRGTRLMLTYQDEVDMVPYAFETGVVVGDDNSLVVELPQTIIRLQRRQYVRVPIALMSEIISFDQNSRTYKSFSCISIDLSGGGMAVQLPGGYQMYIGDVIGIKFQLPGEQKSISAKARIVNKRIAGRALDPIRVGVEFIDLPETDRQAIIRCVFRRQIELHRD